MKEPWIALVAIFCNALAQFAMKHAGRDGIAASGGGWFSYWLLSAVAFYGLSFLLTIRVYAANPLSVASPLMVGGTFLLIVLGGWLAFGESISITKLIGIMFILSGIVILSRS